MFCSKCGHQLPDGSGFCSQCGAKITAQGEKASAQPQPEAEPADSPQPEAPQPEAPQPEAPQPDTAQGHPGYTLTLFRQKKYIDRAKTDVSLNGAKQEPMSGGEKRTYNLSSPLAELSISAPMYGTLRMKLQLEQNARVEYAAVFTGVQHKLVLTDFSGVTILE